MPSSPEGLPYAMQITPVRSGNGGNTFADGFDQRLQVFERAAGQHAMTEIEDVARAPGRLPEHLPRPADPALKRADQPPRDPDALAPPIVPDAPPARVGAAAPAERKDV